MTCIQSGEAPSELPTTWLRSLQEMYKVKTGQVRVELGKRGSHITIQYVCVRNSDHGTTDGVPPALLMFGWRVVTERKQLWRSSQDALEKCTCRTIPFVSKLLSPHRRDIVPSHDLFILADDRRHRSNNDVRPTTQRALRGTRRMIPSLHLRPWSRGMFTSSSNYSPAAVTRLSDRVVSATRSGCAREIMPLWKAHADRRRKL
ncbi:hypothetical protein EVAR_96402_1 [Eumeta japonica]|uniref:Uncharacterized protein n=1 Tax=Eumeta variegata TaxID=151549 RepID=A0A4C1WDV1_EUMVA|nr:hypothetical protein EVAR_96402_1 [Eumeta japonica]